MADEARYHYPFPADEVFTAALQVLTFGPMDLVNADPTSRVLAASTSLNAMTYGEDIRIDVQDDGVGSSTVHIHSQLKFGVTAWGHNRKNVELIHNWLEAYLSITSAGAPGWFADPFGRQQYRYYDGTNFLDQNNVPMIAAPPGTTPAGWYPNPEAPNQQRYWDGTQWTEHTAPL